MRSTSALSLSPMRWLPHGSSIGAETVPVTVDGPRDALDRDLAVDGDRVAVEADISAVKRSSGKRSASKKSGLCRCAARFSSLTSTLATLATPSRPCGRRRRPPG